MANEGEFPKVDGDIFYASEANNMIKTQGIITKLNFGNNNESGYINFNEGNGTIIEYFSGATAESVTNLTHNTDVDEYFSVVDGAYELVTDNYLIDSNATKCAVFFDYNIYKELSETDLSSTQSGAGTDTDTSAVDIAAEKIVYFKFDAIARRNVADVANSYIKITDGAGNSDAIISVNSTVLGPEEKIGFCKLYINHTTNIIKYAIKYRHTRHVDIASYSTETISDVVEYGEIDISSYGANLYLRTVASASDGGSASSTIYYQRAEKLNPSTTAIISISGDGGSNYTVLDSNYSIGHFTAGSTIKAKIAGTLAANEGINIKGVIIKPYA